MAIVQNPITGRTRKKFGTAVFSKHYEKNTMRSSPIQVSNPRTEGQVRQRSKFAQTVDLIRQVLPIVNDAYSYTLKNMSPDSIPVIITKGLMNTPVSLLETTYSQSKAWVENGTLKHTLDQRPSTIPIILPGAIHTSTSNTVQTIKVPYYINRPVTKPFTWWHKLFLWTGVIAWWVMICLLVLKLKKFYPL